MNKFCIIVLGLLMISAVHASSIKLYANNANWNDKWMITIPEQEDRYTSFGLTNIFIVSDPVVGALTLKFDHGATITQLKTIPTCVILSPKGSRIRDDLYLLFPEGQRFSLVMILTVYDLLQGVPEDRKPRFSIALKDGKVIIKRSLNNATPDEKEERFVFTEKEFVEKCTSDDVAHWNIEIETPEECNFWCV